ncbi:N-6 DNA methylase [Pseudomonas mosselii]|uniref:restriction endonuclease subunit M n=1 Tax=Pseudomonas mosselii TaxID=78327 RepID=UPI0021A6DD9D|nr:N-6 DNA methylase [Pseudomonas mosselii]MEA3235724.1 N-6 DNA methylase [Pseudomonas mosselii]UWS66857.1 N-6 DNA methylase [Pseudomonas mosselii]
MKPEEIVRQTVIGKLEALGWQSDRLQWKPEWQVPLAPHDLSKRERGQKYNVAGSADLVAFADNSHQSYALQVIFEFKAADIDAGREQLMRYLSMEPMAKMGYWTNGTQTLAIYKQHINEWLEIPGAPLPQPDDDLTRPPSAVLTWNTLRLPTDVELTAALKRLVATVVVQDSRSTRREDQLRELLHVMLVKLDNDAYYSLPKHAMEPVRFRVYGNEHDRIKKTAEVIRRQFKEYFAKQQNRVFNQDDHDEIKLTDTTLYRAVAELSQFRILGDDMDVLSKAFQVFRASALKSGEGQFLTPQRVIRPCVMALEITSDDTVIDPACGTGGFLHEALRQVKENEFPEEAEAYRIVKYANDNLYGVDMDSIGVKLTKALMIAFRDGSTHVLQGDSVRVNSWPANFPHLQTELGSKHQADGVARKFTVVLTNPPFGESLKVSAADARAGKYTISKAAALGKKSEYVELEIGLIFLEHAYRLLQVGGRVGIILPETYFFSFSYRWLPDWLDGRMKLRGMVNIPMEAFEEFCRAKTNFYIFEKISETSTKEESQ